MNSLRASLLLLLFLLPLGARAEVPILINCQGRLYDGKELLNGDVRMKLRVYTNAVAGAYIYEDTASVKVVEGVYSTYLGDDTSFGSLSKALSTGEAFLEVVAADIVFSPRERLVAVPYAMVADRVAPRGISSEMIREGAVTPSHLADGAVSEPKIAPGSVSTRALADQAVTGDKLAPGALSGEALADGSIGAGKLAADAVASTHIVNGSITGEDLKDGAIPPEKLVQSYWSTAGNIVTPGKANFIGTLDQQPMDLRANNQRVLRLEATSKGSNITAGHEANRIGASSLGSSILGGGLANDANQVNGNYSSVIGGSGNRVRADYSLIGGGEANEVLPGDQPDGEPLRAATISGGYSNVVDQSYAMVGGGYHNHASGYVSSIAGGWGNAATGAVSTVGGGQDNRAMGSASVVAGGWLNAAEGYGAAVSGGRSNLASGHFAYIGGGTNNTASGAMSAVLGGSGNRAEGNLSMAGGKLAQALHHGTFVWSDASGGSFRTTDENQFIIRASNGVGIGTASPREALDVEGLVRARGFVGDGSKLTGIRADEIANGSVSDANIAVGAAIAPEKIMGNALTEETLFEGDVAGTRAKIVLRPGTVSNASVAGDAAIDPAKIAGTALTAKSVFAGQVTGTADELALAEGSVHDAIIKEDANIAPAKISGTALTRKSPFGGEVEGLHDGLRIRPGSITPDKLAPAVMQQMQQAAAIGARLAGKVVKLDAASKSAAPDAQGFSLGNANQRWNGLYLSGDLDVEKELVFRQKGQALLRLDAAGSVNANGLRVVPSAESPNLRHGHAANKLRDGAAGATLSGGGSAQHPNSVLGDFGTVSGGFGNVAAGFDSTIAGGQDNQAQGSATFIGGGYTNKAQGDFSTVSGGAANEATSQLGAIGGGFKNKVTGVYAVIPGGAENVATGDFSFAAGRMAQAQHPGSFVWADSRGGALASTAPDQLTLRASGGVIMYSDPVRGAGVKLAPGAGSWSMLSDRNQKHALQAVDAEDILERLNQLPLQTWSYKSEAAGIRHLGPIAQDFHAAFGLGADPRYIDAIDSDGIALTAIQGLYRKVQSKDVEIDALKKENRALESRVKQVEDALQRLLEREVR